MPIKRVKLDALGVLMNKKKRVSKKKASKASTKDVFSVPITKKNITKKLPQKARTQKSTATRIAVLNATPATTMLAVTRNQLSLALLSPFRFPIDNSQLASNVARYAGVFFVLIGAFFTLWNMQFVSGSYAQLPTMSQLALTGTEPTYDCVNTTSPTYNATYCSGTAGTMNVVTPDPKPKADVVIEGTKPYTNMVPINVYVPYAESIDLFGYFKDENRNVTFGTAFKVSETQWRFYLDTTQYLDGNYDLKILVTNEYGSYTQTESSSITIENHPVQAAPYEAQQVPVPAGTSTPTTTPDAPPPQPTATTTVPSVVLRITDTPPIKGNVTLSVVVKDASQVKLFVRKENGTFATLGYATNHGNDEWRFEWNTVAFPDAHYTLKAQGIFGSSSYQSNTIVTEIDNTNAETATTTTNTATTTPTLEPTVTLTVPTPGPLRGNVDVYVSVNNASTIELFIKPKQALTPYFLGVAQKKDASHWKFVWDTKQTPNGEYALFARVKHQYGITESKPQFIALKNSTEKIYTEAEIEAMKKLENVQTELKDGTRTVGDETPREKSVIVPVYVTPITAIAEEIEMETDEREMFENLLRTFRAHIEKDVQAFSRAARAGDEDQMNSIRERIENSRTEFMNSFELFKDQPEVLQKIDEHLKKIIHEIDELTIRNEKVIAERIGDAVNVDSDRDGITDYDEVNLYQTDPYTADTDGDGFIDGTEVIAGYDPNDSVPQALVVYESPKDTGIVREDILEVKTIASIGPELETSEPLASETAIITGKGLPNSFVTLYIYSTPIVMTVKTDEAGSWSYIFDKELDNGEHEVYVGITDNAGHIVAKSNPFSFIKTAQAFTPIDAKAESITAADTPLPSLFNKNIILVVASISIVALGLVLILLGLHVRPKRTLELVTQ